MTSPPEGPRGWSPWAPRPGSGDATPGRRLPDPAPIAKAAGLPTIPPTPQPWVAAAPNMLNEQSGGGVSTAPLPARPPLREPAGLPAGLAPRPPTTWTRPRATGTADESPPEGGGSGHRRRLLVAALGALIGALVIGLVFAGYAIGHRSSDSSAGTARIRTGGASLDVQQILKAVQPSVVSILTGHTTTFYDSAGSGVVISKDGLILTNNHVIEGAKQITVKFNDGSQATATLVGASADNDIALINADQTGTVPAELGSSQSLEVGEDVVAIGNALNLGGAPSVTRGIISAKDRSLSTPSESLDHLIQTDAAINHGNSGGPLVNAKGEVVGINTAIFENAQSIGFSIAIDSVKALIKDLKKGKGAVAPDEAFFGVQTVDVDSPDLDQAVKDQFGVTSAHGAFITQVTKSSAAEDAGLQEGDVIVEVDANSVSSSQDVSDIIGNHKPGDRINVTVERDGRRRSFDVTLRKRGG